MTPLEKWLSDATRGLSAESAAQVRTEIQEHHDSASEAGDDAIAALGDPRAANRGYRKALLTETEAIMAPGLTRPKRPSFLQVLLRSALLVPLWLLLREIHSGWTWPVLLAAYGTGLCKDFLRPSLSPRVYLGVAGAGSILVAAFAWWYQGWTSALVLGAVFLFLNYFFFGRFLPVFRKLAAGQTYSPLPGEPRLTHVEAMTLRRLEMGDLHEKPAAAVLFLIVGGMTVWLPATLAPMTIWMVAVFLAQRTLPIYTEERGRWFRICKWTTMALAAALPVLYGARLPWSGAIYMAFLFVLFDKTNISLRRKLPAAQWPKRLYW